jgi:hypothetical protein
MTGDKKISRLSIDNAARRVGEAMFGDDWIDQITKREKWLIDRYVEGRGTQAPSSIFPGRITYVGHGRSWVELPRDPALVAEVDRARDRRDWCDQQWALAFDWLEEHGFDLEATGIDEDTFDAAAVSLRELEPAAAEVGEAPMRALKASAGETGSKRTRGRKPRIPRGHIESVVFELLDMNGDVHGLDPEWNSQGQIEAAARKKLEKQFGTRNVPGESTLRLYVSVAHKKWLADKGR